MVPLELQGIFNHKQKSYKMVLILSILEVQSEAVCNHVSFLRVKERFLAYYTTRVMEGKVVDQPPEKLVGGWKLATVGQSNLVISTPIDALSDVIEINKEEETIGFKQHIWEQMTDASNTALREYAQTELDRYNSQLTSHISLRDNFNQILTQYINAKKDTFAKHPLGKLVRRDICEEIKKIPIIDSNLIIKGSIGQGNWANIPWIAIMDQRITSSTQQGEYVVYLFSEDMSSLYLTLNQGVTIPKNEKGIKEGYKYLERKVHEMRELLPLENMSKDDNIFLASDGYGKDYQVSTVAYIKYDINDLPNDEQLISDLTNVIENYKLYVSNIVDDQVKEVEKAVFKYTMARLSYGQGIVHYLGLHHPRLIPLDELISNQVDVLKSGDDVKHPKERIQHIARAFIELGIIHKSENTYGLTDFGMQYFSLFDTEIWNLSESQGQLIRALVNSASNVASELIRVIQMAIMIAKHLIQFTFEQFNKEFIQSMGMEQDWVEVTQKDRSKFMLNWLQEIGCIVKTDDGFNYLENEVKKPVDTRPVIDKIKSIKAYIRQKGFQFPDHLIENYYLSLKSKPFVILAGISGTGKTKLVQLFAEAVGATRENKQYTLIPVRPDWSDPSDLIGYKELTGFFHAGPITEVLVEASKPENRDKPYFICLDEMNLARVEHYFSDLLSIMETQDWNAGRIVTNPILSKKSMEKSTDQEMYGDLSIPENLFIVGTVNIDETTYPFSKKVLDRANTIEFNYINLNLFPEVEESLSSGGLGVIVNEFLRSDYLWLSDAYMNHQALIQKVTKKIIGINDILEEIHSHVGFRVRDAICFYMIYNERFSLLNEDQAFDLQLLQKIIPRIQGSNQSVKRVLIEMLLLCMNQNKSKAEKDELESDASALYISWQRSATTPDAIYPNSARKLAYMLRRLEDDGFTSFWLS